MKRTFFSLATSAILAGCAPLPGPAEADFTRIQPGMSQDETRRILGDPPETMKFSRSGTESWDWRLLDTWGYNSMFSVIFGPDGRVVGRVTQRLNDGGDHN
jgi:hypothetical protein